MHLNNSSTIILMVNNYSHDIATAFLAVSGVTMWLLWREFNLRSVADSSQLLFGIYEAVEKTGALSLIWIVVAGIPRILNYREFEWSSMAGDLQIVAIVIKHMVMFLLVGTGLYYWVRLRRRVYTLKIKNNIC